MKPQLTQLGKKYFIDAKEFLTVSPLSMLSRMMISPLTSFLQLGQSAKFSPSWV